MQYELDLSWEWADFGHQVWTGKKAEDEEGRIVEKSIPGNKWTKEDGWMAQHLCGILGKLTEFRV